MNRKLDTPRTETNKLIKREISLQSAFGGGTSRPGNYRQPTSKGRVSSGLDYYGAQNRNKDRTEQYRAITPRAFGDVDEEGASGIRFRAYNVSAQSPSTPKMIARDVVDSRGSVFIVNDDNSGSVTIRYSAQNDPSYWMNL